MPQGRMSASARAVDCPDARHTSCRHGPSDVGARGVLNARGSSSDARVSGKPRGTDKRRSARRSRAVPSRVDKACTLRIELRMIETAIASRSVETGGQDNRASLISKSNHRIRRRASPYRCMRSGGEHVLRARVHAMASAAEKRMRRFTIESCRASPFLWQESFGSDRRRPGWPLDLAFDLANNRLSGEPRWPAGGREAAMRLAGWRRVRRAAGGRLRWRLLLAPAVGLRPRPRSRRPCRAQPGASGPDRGQQDAPGRRPATPPSSPPATRLVGRGRRAGHQPQPHAEITGDGQRTRFSLHLSAAVPYQIFTLADPYRLIIDMPDVELPAAQGRRPARAGAHPGLSLRPVRARQVAHRHRHQRSGAGRGGRHRHAARHQGGAPQHRSCRRPIAASFIRQAAAARSAHQEARERPDDAASPAPGQTPSRSSSSMPATAASIPAPSAAR